MIQKVRATQDDSGHWYVIPEELSDKFYEDLNNYSDFYNFEDFYGQYRTSGDLNNIQLYADLKD